MKALAKYRQTEAMAQEISKLIDERDRRAFVLILSLILSTLAGTPWKWGPKRLQRVHDSAIALMNGKQNEPDWKETIEKWASEMGLTEEAMLERQKEATK